MTSVTVIGCGYGGQALASDLTQRGYKVTLYAHPKHPGGLHAIKKAGGIHCRGLINAFVPIPVITNDLHQAMLESKYIIIALPSHAHEAIFFELIAFIKPGQIVITLSANFASLILLKLLLRTHKTNDIDLIDVASLPYVCRSDNEGNVEIVAVKNKLAAATIPANAIHKHKDALSLLLPCKIIPYQNVLSLGMNITNGVIHPVVALLNAGRINKEKEAFYFYKEGITPEVAAVVERLDAERLRIGYRLGLQMYSFLELNAEYYGTMHESIYQFYRESKAHSAILGPTSLQQRFITEDVAGSLVSWYCLGRLVQIEPVVISNLIHLASFLNNNNYLCTGTNLECLNLHNKSVDEVKHYITTGKCPEGLISIEDDFKRAQREASLLGCIA